MQTVADKLNALLQEKTTTAYGAAKKIGYTPQAVYSWSRGETVPKMDAIKKLSEAFGVPVTYFTDD